MDEFDLRALQLCELDLLKEVDRICKKHDIPYFLAFGTALGAVRHKGFIPWDDDVDVLMKYPDYLRFQEVCKTELPPHLFYQDWQTDPAYYLPWAKIRNSRTTSLVPEMADYPINWGVCVDIFPLFPMKEETLSQWSLFKIKNIVFSAPKGSTTMAMENTIMRTLCSSISLGGCARACATCFTTASVK